MVFLSRVFFLLCCFIVDSPFVCCVQVLIWWSQVLYNSNCGAKAAAEKKTATELNTCQYAGDHTFNMLLSMKWCKKSPSTPPLITLFYTLCRINIECVEGDLILSARSCLVGRASFVVYVALAIYSCIVIYPVSCFFVVFTWKLADSEK